MDWLEGVAGALLIVSPLNYRWSMSRVRSRVRERGGDVERFEKGMSRAWIRATLGIAPILGVLVVLLGVTDS